MRGPGIRVDCHNLALKLAFVVKELVGRRSVASYSIECVCRGTQICAEAGKSTRFMTPPTKGFRLMRDAVLSLSLSEEFAKDLLHWRTSRPHKYRSSTFLNSPGGARRAQGGDRAGWRAPVRLAEDDC